MRKALFILMLVVVGVIVGVLLSPRKPVWQPETRITFIGLMDVKDLPPVTNVWRIASFALMDLKESLTGTNAVFVINNMPKREVAWDVVEISHQEGGKWKRREPLPGSALKFDHSGTQTKAIVPVPVTNAPLRVVFEMEQFQMALKTPPTGKVARVSWDLRMRWKRWRHPDRPNLWSPRGPLFYITNEFNLATGRMP